MCFAAGVITTTANNIDFEASHPPFELSIEVSDGTDTDTAVLTLNIVNVNENPYFDPAAYTLDGPEGPVVCPVSLSLSLSQGVVRGFILLKPTKTW